MKTKLRTSARKSNKTQITVSLSRRAFDELSLLTKALRLRRDAYLNEHLADEAREHLAKISSNSVRGAKFKKLERSDIDRVRITIALDRSVAETVSEICRQKKIDRDAFIERYIELLTGLAGNVSPLHVAKEYLENPRRPERADEWEGAYDALTISDEVLDQEVELARELTDQVSRDDVLDAIEAIVGRKGRERALQMLDNEGSDDQVVLLLDRFISDPRVRDWLVANRGLVTPSLDGLLAGLDGYETTRTKAKRGQVEKDSE